MLSKTATGMEIIKNKGMDLSFFTIWKGLCPFLYFEKMQTLCKNKIAAWKNPNLVINIPATKNGKDAMIKNKFREKSAHIEIRIIQNSK